MNAINLHCIQSLGGGQFREPQAGSARQGEGAAVAGHARRDPAVACRNVVTADGSGRIAVEVGPVPALRRALANEGNGSRWWTRAGAWRPHRHRAAMIAAGSTRRWRASTRAHAERGAAAEERERVRRERHDERTRRASSDPHDPAARQPRASGRKDIVREQRDTTGYARARAE
ncbi:hypothetical protein AB5I41_11040 [Sphingomonas sp. MMS24-JH45]